VNSKLSCAVFTDASAEVDRRRGAEHGLDIVVELTARDGSRLRQRPVTLDVAGGPAELRLRLGVLPPPPWSSTAWNGRGSISKSRSPLLDQRALDVVLPDQVARDLGLDLGIDEAVEGGDPFGPDRDVLLDDVDHRDAGARAAGADAAAPDWAR